MRPCGPQLFRTAFAAPHLDVQRYKALTYTSNVCPERCSQAHAVRVKTECCHGPYDPRAGALNVRVHVSGHLTESQILSCGRADRKYFGGQDGAAPETYMNIIYVLTF